MAARTAIRVISLEGANDRRQAFSQMALRTKLDWEFFPAYRNIAAPLSYDSRSAVRRYGNHMTVPEIGCYTSHFKLWEWLLASEYDQLIIFEDDIVVDWGVIERAAAARFSDYGIDLLRFSTTIPFKSKLVMHRLLSPHIHLVRVAGESYGMQGYLLTKVAAQTLVSKYSAIAAPVDYVLPRYWEHNVVNYCLFPFPLFVHDVPSTIGDDRRNTHNAFISDRIVRFGWHIWDKIKRAYVEFCLIKKRPLGPDLSLNEVFIKTTNAATE